MKKWYKKMILLLLVIVLVVLAGCQKEDENEGKDKYSVYYLNREETKNIEYVYYSEPKEPIKMVGELLTMLAQPSGKYSYNEPIRDFMVTAYSIKADTVHISMDENYRNMSPTREILVRAAIVRTLTQVKGIHFVDMRVGDGELTDGLGRIVGPMTADQFVDNSGNEINTYEKVNLKLYFASANGEYLIKTTRQVEYNSNIALERVALEQLIQGPDTEDLYSTINPTTKIINIVVQDNICYVNLSKEALLNFSNVTPDATIYSIVNTLIELNGINKVQISIEGESDVIYRESVELTSLFERNLDILKGE